MAEDIKKISFEDFTKEQDKISNLELAEKNQLESVRENKNIIKEPVSVNETINQPVEKEKASEIIAPAPVTQKSPAIKKIEGILEEDLSEVYFKMADDKQREFKKAGEETAVSIVNILKNPKYKVQNILDLIRKWLLLIPGVNKFFLEQEAKIKTDKLIESLRNDFK